MNIAGTAVTVAMFVALGAATVTGCKTGGTEMSSSKGASGKETTGAVTMKGNPVTLVGTVPEVGDPAPAFTVVANDLSAASLSDYDGKIRILSTVPSLDTPVCDMQTRRFNEEAAKLGDDVVILTISMDLPFAQKRWCGAAGVDRVVTLSDYREREMGPAYGILIRELGLLARAVFVVDPEGKVQYAQVVQEVTEHPDYEAALDVARKLQGA